MSPIDKKSDIKMGKDSAQYTGLGKGEDFMKREAPNWIDGGKDKASDNKGMGSKSKMSYK